MLLVVAIAARSEATFGSLFGGDSSNGGSQPQKIVKIIHVNGESLGYSGGHSSGHSSHGAPAPVINLVLKSDGGHDHGHHDHGYHAAPQIVKVIHQEDHSHGHGHGGYSYSAPAPQVHHVKVVQEESHGGYESAGWQQADNSGWQSGGSSAGWNGWD